MTKEKNKWLRFRRQWLKDNPPNHQNYYECHYCHKWIPAYEITLDHILPRSGRPDLRYDPSNIVPSCSNCNSLKGSKRVLD